MRTVLFSTSLLSGYDVLGSARMERTRRYLSYYAPLKEALGYDHIWFADDASPKEMIQELITENKDLFVYRYEKPLPRGFGNDYPYVWRGTYFLRELIRMGYKKIITCDTDAFLLSPKVVNFVRNLESGYSAFWCPRYQYPAAEITILCEDAFPRILQWCEEKTWEDRSETKVLFEAAPPFTHIVQHYVGDRYGEFVNESGMRGLPQTPEMDYYTQAQNRIPLIFDLKGQALPAR